MAYCDSDDLALALGADRLLQLASDDGEELDTDVVAGAVADAEAEIDAYCGARYAVPFSTVPGIIRKRCVDLAVYALYGRAAEIPEDVQRRRDDAVAFLKDVSRGTAGLGASAPDPDAGPSVSTSKTDRIFTNGRPSSGTSGSLDGW
jgi:phage gp36-like protein